MFIIIYVSKAVVVQVVKISLRLSYFKSLQHYVSWSPVHSPRIGRESVSNNYVKRALTLPVNLVPRPSFFLVSENEERTRKTNWLSFWMGYNDFNASHESNTSLIKKYIHSTLITVKTVFNQASKITEIVWNDFWSSAHLISLEISHHFFTQSDVKLKSDTI